MTRTRTKTSGIKQTAGEMLLSRLGNATNILGMIADHFGPEGRAVGAGLMAISTGLQMANTQIEYKNHQISAAVRGAEFGMEALQAATSVVPFLKARGVARDAKKLEEIKGMKAMAEGENGLKLRQGTVSKFEKQLTQTGSHEWYAKYKELFESRQQAETDLNAAKARLIGHELSPLKKSGEKIGVSRIADLSPEEKDLLTGTVRDENGTSYLYQGGTIERKDATNGIYSIGIRGWEEGDSFQPTNKRKLFGISDKPLTMNSFSEHFNAADKALNEHLSLKTKELLSAFRYDDDYEPDNIKALRMDIGGYENAIRSVSSYQRDIEKYSEQISALSNKISLKNTILITHAAKLGIGAINFGVNTYALQTNNQQGGINQNPWWTIG